MRAYLDTNVVSTIARDHIPQESAAVDKLLQASEDGKVEILTSRVTEEEIARCAGAGRKILERAYRLIRKVAYVETSVLLGFNSYGDRYTWISTPLMQDDPIWTRLKAIGLDDKDAHHTMIAIKSSCEWFSRAMGESCTTRRKSRRSSAFGFCVRRSWWLKSGGEVCLAYRRAAEQGDAADEAQCP